MRIPTRIRVAAAVACAGAVLGGCASAGADAGAAAQETGASQAGSSSDPVTAKRAQYVLLMLQNSYAAGPETQAGAMSVIAGYGGGYVTGASLTGSGVDEALTVQVVLGAGTVRDSMQGETDFGVAGVACCSYTLNYRTAEDVINQFSCPAYLTDVAARAQAARQIGDETAAEHYDKPVKQIPTTLEAARTALFPTPAAYQAADVQLAAADFATGTDDVLNLPMSALALPQQDGACEYVLFRWIRASRVGGGTSSTSQTALTRAWVAPTGAGCTGSAALAAGAFLTADSDAGG